MSLMMPGMGAAAGAAAQAATISPLVLFLQADIVVKVVMLGLLLASIWTWAMIIGFTFTLRRASRQSSAFEDDFWKAEDIDRFFEARGKADFPAAKVMAAGVTEWRRSTAQKVIDREGTRDRLSTSMSSTIATEIDRLSDRLNILATIGAVAPFVGLFGTVWGIMRAFTAIAAEQNSSLAVVAPGIAEALFATAIGLFAAIPAVIAYNRFSHGINRMEAKLTRFADGFYSTLSRELEAQR
ncbi:protein TolQ [Sphingobium vermicomposti]|uniref:Biopolymer transport protein TolQ n=1 Tax=Sphingobium vermicomposti TaxID=529005 RepID=A0A846M1P6_9SPHN|nr:protein TolQ [Sphingobium vermicomposti]NIJ15852.1 biopolymer transport protein TolQ [Sphingobium vermicomposti]